MRLEYDKFKLGVVSRHRLKEEVVSPNLLLWQPLALVAEALSLCKLLRG